MIYSELNNETLVNLTLLGNENAYEALVIRYQNAVITSALAVTRDRFWAEDAAQDAFVSAWLRLDTLREYEKFGAWVCRIARNRAKNIVMRNREWIPFDEIENTTQEADEVLEELASPDEDCERLYLGIGKLSEKVRRVIVMHYLDGLSIAEISDRLRIPVGTVKYRLHSGRELLRKDMGNGLNEQTNEAFVEKVMKKVEEIKQWGLKNNKTGFEKLYREVLGDLDLLPDSEEKFHALADVLVRGSWWIPGEKNNELMERIREAAEKGKNEEVLMTVLNNEWNKLSGVNKIELMRDKQIPRMQEQGYKKCEAYVWFWLGREYYILNERQNGFDAYQKVLELLSPADIIYANALSALRAEERYKKCKERDMITVLTTAIELRMIDGKPRYLRDFGYRRGELTNKSGFSFNLLWFASYCDTTFYDPNMKIGEVCTGSNTKRSLTFLDDKATAETAVGTFYDCQLWETKAPEFTTRVWYKHNVGIVRMEHLRGSETELHTLKDYHIAGGTGLIPLAAGNRWKYDCPTCNPNSFVTENEFEVTSYDGTSAILKRYSCIERIGIDESSWREQMLYIRNHYATSSDDDGMYLLDVTPQMQRAEQLAKSPLEKAHTRMANKTMQRILNTDKKFNPNRTASGHWNFFHYLDITEENGKIQRNDSRVYSFEWKESRELFGTPGYALFYNHMTSIFSDAFDRCLWDQSWKIGDSGAFKNYRYYGKETETEYSIEDGGTVITEAGSFDSCMLIRINWKNVEGGWKYRGGKMEYYFAPSVGIVRAIHHYDKDQSAVYELTSYTGTGNGYFPFDDGLERHYRAVGLPDEYEGAVDYVCFKDKSGHLIMLEDCTGIRHLSEKAEKTPELTH
ncbi:MAG: RNA polymerase sigma factor [Clostridia bacterium]|nr:RNA polymerase sigma factor [Clostridia bacterium]